MLEIPLDKFRLVVLSKNKIPQLAKDTFPLLTGKVELPIPSMLHKYNNPLKLPCPLETM